MQKLVSWEWASPTQPISLLMCLEQLTNAKFIVHLLNIIRDGANVKSPTATQVFIPGRIVEQNKRQKDHNRSANAD